MMLGYLCITFSMSNILLSDVYVDKPSIISIEVNEEANENENEMLNDVTNDQEEQTRREIENTLVPHFVPNVDSVVGNALDENVNHNS